MGKSILSIVMAPATLMMVFPLGLIRLSKRPLPTTTVIRVPSLGVEGKVSVVTPAKSKEQMSLGAAVAEAVVTWTTFPPLKAAKTNAVVAICVVLVPGAAVGALGVCSNSTPAV